MRSNKRNARITSSARPESDSRATDAKRRGFLLALGAGGIGAAAIAAHSLPGAAPAAVSSGADAASGEGYRVTDHVKRYYETTKT